MRKVELALVASIALLFALYLIGLNVGVLLGLAFTLLVMLYLFLSFAFFNNIRLRHVFKKHSYAHTTSKRILGTIGIGLVMVFYLDLIAVSIFHSLPIHLFGLPETIALGVPIVYLVLRYFKDKDAFYIPILKRVCIAYGIVVLFKLLPCHFTQSIRYRNNPGYIVFLDWVETQRMTDDLKALKEYNDQQADSTLAASTRE